MMECSFFKDKPVKTHLELSEAVELARKSSVKKLLLTHLYAEWDEVDLVAEAKKLWQGETLEAYDGLRLEL
jgi:ribonuclease BN (tRNA processing enzyme)